MGRTAYRSNGREDPFQLNLFESRPTSPQGQESFALLKLPPKEVSSDLLTFTANRTDHSTVAPAQILPKAENSEIPSVPSLQNGSLPAWPAAIIAPEPEPLRNRRNYRITEQDVLGTGGLKRKCRDNLAALALLKQIESEARAATDDEKRVLVRYVGWGGLPQIFDPHNDKWQGERIELESLLTQEEWESARATTLNAHYTPPVVIDFMYAALRRLGFTEGRILEPACGLGHFVGLMSEDLHPRVHMTGIEIDGVTARLARLLYPDADIRHSPFEEAKLPDQFFDVALSNIPFGDYRPYDPRFQSWKFPIHDYFFAAALENVRPGGLILFVTSKGTLDKREGGLRDYLGQRADLVAAVRLPTDTFKENANTEVTTDIVILRKRLPGGVPSGPAWRELAELTNGQGETFWVNEYFVKYPHLMLGEMQLSGRMYRSGEPTLVSNGRPLADQLLKALAFLPRNIFQNHDVPAPFVSVLAAPEEIKPHAFCLAGGLVARREGDRLVLQDDISPQVAARVKGLIRLREVVRQCLATQLEEAEETKVIAARELLNQIYDRFVFQHGFISTRSNIMAFKGDPDLPLLLSLEHRENENEPPKKAALFRERTLERTRRRVEVSTAREALLVTLNERGCVDLEFLGKVLPKPRQELLQELKGIIFLNPQSNLYETDDQYLSGNVKAKLRTAEAAVLIDPVFAPNVEALRDVQPLDLAFSEIDARLGSTWIPADDIQQFAEELLGEKPIPVTHVPELGLWLVKGGWSTRLSVANTTEWGTERRGALELLEDSLNLRTPTIYDEQGRDETPVVNPTATEAARDKQQKIKDRFKAWIWEEDSRRERLARKYNDEFNHNRLRTFIGEHLTLPGASSAIILRPHQKAAIWRILQSPNCLLAHSVGAGIMPTAGLCRVEPRHPRVLLGEASQAHGIIR